jgi:hypothetical protein
VLSSLTLLFFNRRWKFCEHVPTLHASPNSRQISPINQKAACRFDSSEAEKSVLHRWRADSVNSQDAQWPYFTDSSRRVASLRWSMYLCGMPSYAETMLAAYEEARLEGAKLSDREKLEAYWLAKLDWFSNRLARTSQMEADLQSIDVDVPTALSEAIQTLMRIVEVCQKHYELYD